MELNEQIFLGACALLAPEVNEHGLTGAEDRVTEAIDLALKVWDAIVARSI